MAEVAVLGLGNMGSALARVLLAAGRHVVVWNRTGSKCGPLASEGADVATSAPSAVEAAPVVIASVLDYRVLEETLADRVDLTGRTLINLCWGSPEEALKLAELVSAQGGHYVDGDALCRPVDIGSPTGDILYSGPSDLIDKVRSVLAAFGPVHYVGPDITQANALALALGPLFYTGVLSFLEAVAYAERHGISVDVVASLAQIPLMLAASTAVDSVAQIKGRDFTGADASNSVHAAALGSVSDAFASAGIEHRLTDAVVSYFDSALRLGLADEQVSALLRVVSTRAT
jgi:3-hydroxyisobutyrate dehydrogenase-like beta-hydroxyacid dehydrogenase